MQASTAMFQNTIVYGGHFTQQNLATTTPRRGLELLQKRVATSAFHNSAQRNEPSRCHPNTRVTILREIFDQWISRSKDREQWLLWLNGAAGAGKSAIMQTLAERCVSALIPIATFFFFREDPTRNSIGPLVATLAYQCILAIPEISDSVLSTIEHNPLIFDQSLQTQFYELLLQPLVLILQPQSPLVMFIDGLDECSNRDDQCHLVRLLGNVSRSRNSPIIFLIASRREPQIEASFLQHPVSRILRTVQLDNADIERTSDDIRHFLTDRFQNIKETHLRKHLLTSDWPSQSAIEDIVAKSSGQFIYASVVINFISSPHAHPALRLDIIKGIRPPKHSENPFAQLDAVYQYIFSRVKDLDMVRNILAFKLATSTRTTRYENEVSTYEGVFGLERGELEVLFADLTAVIQCDSVYKPFAKVKFLHASLPDFLQDKDRSEQQYLDLKECCIAVLCILLERSLEDSLSPAYNYDAIAVQESFRLFAIRELLQEVVEPSPRLQRAVMNFACTFQNVKPNNRGVNTRDCVKILHYLKNMDFQDNGEAYQHVVNVFAQGYATFWPSLKDYIKDTVRQSAELWARVRYLQN